MIVEQNFCESPVAWSYVAGSVARKKLCKLITGSSGVHLSQDFTQCFHTKESNTVFHPQASVVRCFPLFSSVLGKNSVQYSWISYRDMIKFLNIGINLTGMQQVDCDNLCYTKMTHK